MSDLQKFRQNVTHYRKRKYTAEGKRYTQENLAVAIGLSADELSHRLRGNGRLPLSQENILAIVIRLAAWEMLTWEEAVDLLESMDYPLDSPRWEAELQLYLSPPAQVEKLTAALPNYEQSYRERIKARFVEEGNYFVPLSYETAEVIATLSDESHVARPNQRHRRRVEADYYEWFWMEKEQEIKRVKLKNLVEGVNKYPCVILLGDPGSGKTMALKNLAYHFAHKVDKMPLFLRLGEFRSGMSLEDFIVDSWGGSLDTHYWAAPELAANLEGYLETGKLFFLFDGLNEMLHQDYNKRVANLRRFIDKWQQKGNRFVVSCRLLDYSEEITGLQRIEVQPLSDDQIRNFLMVDPFVEDWRELWQLLIDSYTGQHRLLDIARNPYLLTIMIDIFNEDRKLSKSRAKLMRRFTKILMSEAKRKCPPEMWLDADIQHEVLSILAFEMQDRAGFGTAVDTKLVKTVMPSRVKVAPDWPPVLSPPDQILELATRAKLIEMPVDRSSVRFYHQLLQEYFAAHRMLNQDVASLSEYWRCPWLETEMPAAGKTSYQNPLPPPPPTKWEETTIMAAGLMPENDTQFLLALLQVNPILAGRCLYEGQVTVEQCIYQAIIEQLLLTIANPAVALRIRIAAGNTLGELGDPRLGELIPVPAGAFLMGSDYGQDNEKPRHKLSLSAYQIGKYPVTNAEYRRFIEAGGYTNSRWWTEAGWAWKGNRVEPGSWQDPWFNKPNQPVVSVTWYECVAYCQWFSAEIGQLYRLPNEAEWEKAARGTQGWQYPWGNKFETNRLNAREGHEPVMTSTPVGIYPEGVSPFGAFDCAGNVWDWCSTNRNKNYPYNVQESEWEGQYLQGMQGRVLRGGSWVSTRAFTRCATRVKFGPDFNNHHCGFRLVFPESLHFGNDASVSYHYSIILLGQDGEHIFAAPDYETISEEVPEIRAKTALDTFLNKYYDGELNFEEIDLSGQDLSGLNMIGIKFAKANLKGINLEGAFLEAANLTHANLEGANLRGAELSKADLTGANLEGANLEDAIFSNTIMPDGSIL